MKIDIIAPALPPKLDGIGDYTANLVRRLATSNDVRVLTTSGDYTPIDGVEIAPAFEYARRASVLSLERRVANRRPDCVLLQYMPFSYGRWGLNPFLPMAIRRIRRASPSTRIALMVHEPFVPVLDWKHAVMTTWQRWQLWSLGHNSDMAFFSIEPWAEEFRSWFPAATVRHLPIASNIPVEPSDPAATRAALGIDPSTIVLGLFGQAHSAVLLDRVLDSWTALERAGTKAVVLYVGPQVDRVKANLPGVRLITTGALDAVDVSRHLAAMDIFLSPFVDGVSTRRGSMMAALEHGLPIVGTVAEHTDTILRRENGESLLLAPVTSPSPSAKGQSRFQNSPLWRRGVASSSEPGRGNPESGDDPFVDHVLTLAADPALRHRMGVNAADFYRRHFSWERIAAKIVDVAHPSSASPGWAQTRELAAK